MIMHKNLAVFMVMGISALTSFAQSSYTSFRTGSEDNLEVQPDFGLCLMGGAGESDEAMTWFIEKANGGDVLVLRTSGSDGYNDYLYSDLGVTLNSVETIVFNSAEASQDPYVIQRLNEAEAIWMAGGNQATYVNYWKDTPVQDAINDLINVKGGALGGISAGMAVMGQAYFPASAGSVNSENALNSPFAPAMVFGYDDFIDAPFMENVITETHLNDPDRIRYGRVTAFLARLGYDQGVEPRAMASNEFCAITIDEDGVARAYGEFPEFDDDYVYFLQSNCEQPAAPEILESGQPLTWNRNQEAVKVYRVTATPSGQNYLDLNDWTTGEGGAWEDWYVEAGELFRLEDAALPACFLSVRAVPTFAASVYPNPARDQIRIKAEVDTWLYHVHDLTGRLLLQGHSQRSESAIDIASLANGIYKLSIQNGGAQFSASFVKYE